MKKIIIYDIEVYPNRFGVALKMLWNGKKYFCDTKKSIYSIPFYDDRYLFVGFNIFKYDQPVIEAYFNGEDVYKVSKALINDEEERVSFNRNCVDLYNQLCPKNYKTSLKRFGHRMGYKTLMNLPYPFDKPLNDDEWEKVKQYSLIHDINITEMLWHILKPEYEARQLLLEFFDCDTHFGGAPRVAEKCILSKLENYYVAEDPKLNLKQVPLRLNSETNDMYNEACGFPVKLYLKGYTPDFMDKKHKVNGVKIKIGIGGLHGLNKPGVYHKAYDYDVTSYYPSLILTCKLGSKKFRDIYQNIYNQRLMLKKKKDKRSDALKLVLNSTFGKMLDTFAKDQMYAPHLGLSITLLGQFHLIDLIEKLKYDQCIVANTDGIITSSQIDQEVIEEWEQRTGLKLEKTEYDLLILKGENSYYAITKDGEEKRKGDFLEPVWSHNFKAPVMQRAVVNKVRFSTEIVQTITESVESFDFLFFAQARKDSSFLLDGEKLDDPKIRYYVSKTGSTLVKEMPPLKGKKENRIISIGKNKFVTLMMDILDFDKIKENIDYDYYIEKANELYEKVCTVRS